MDYRKLGRTDLEVSELCLGSMQFGWTADEKTSLTVLSAAYEAGVNFIDTADVYSKWVAGNPGGVAEQIIGKWLKQGPAQRDQVVIATKVRGQLGDDPENAGLSRRHIMDAVEASLRRLDIDHIDLYQAHWPDEAVPIEETLRAFDDLVQQGKVRYVGCSNYSAEQLSQALETSEEHGLARYDSLQPHYSLVHREEFEAALAELCTEQELGVIPYSPLAGGFLTGKYRKGEQLPDSAREGDARKHFSERNWALLDLMEQIGNTHGGSVSQVALAWQLANPVITSPIIGPRNLEQLKDNLGAAELSLSQAEIEQLNQASDWR